MRCKAGDALSAGASLKVIRVCLVEGVKMRSLQKATICQLASVLLVFSLVPAPAFAAISEDSGDGFDVGQVRESDLGDGAYDSSCSEEPSANRDSSERLEFSDIGDGDFDADQFEEEDNDGFYEAEGGEAEPGVAPEEEGEAVGRNVSLAYCAHVSDIGWQDDVANGETAGTIGRAKAIEALRVNLLEDGIAAPNEIRYAAHVSNIGWQDYASNGEVSGTVGRALPMEAVKIELSGELSQYYDIYYRAHVENLGWLGWACNGGIAGTTGAAYRLEAVEIAILEKGTEPPGSTANSFIPKIGATYSAHVRNIGWQEGVYGGATAGTTGAALPMEALSAKLQSDSPVSGGINYRTHVQDFGWQDWVSDGQVAGTTGRALRMEAVSVELTGDVARYYDVYYRAHVQDYGWLGWAKNGQDAGTTGCCYRLEALQIVIVAKDSAAPGFVGDSLKTEPLLSGMDLYVQSLGSRTGWLLAVDTSGCRVGVYRGSAGNWSNVYTWICAPGKPSTPTKKGIFTVKERGYSFGSGYTCYYWTQFVGDYLFHSVLYRQNTFTIMDGTLGVPASHGCIRLNINNAKWIYDNIPRGTTVYVY